MRKIYLAAALLFSSLFASAQSLPSLLVGADASGFSLGGATVARPSGAFALENNVAGMSLIDGRMAAGVSFGMWQPEYASDKVIGAGASVKVTSNFALGLGFKYFMQPSYEIMTEGGAASRDGMFTPKEYNVALGASYSIFDCLSFGVAARVARSSLAPSAAATVFGADLGVYFRRKGLSAGLSVNNLGNKVKYGENSYAQPMMAKLGAGYEATFGASSLGVLAEADVLFTRAVMAGVGAEYSFRKLLFVRAGYHYGDALKAVPSYASAGLGVKFFGVRIDASYLFGSKVLKNSFGVSLGYEF